MALFSQEYSVPGIVPKRVGNTATPLAGSAPLPAGMRWSRLQFLVVAAGQFLPRGSIRLLAFQMVAAGLGEGAGRQFPEQLQVHWGGAGRGWRHWKSGPDALRPQ